MGILLFALLAGTACSDLARYRVLSFFFDGVPPPGAQRSSQTREELKQRARQTRREPAMPRKPRKVYYYHAPYKDNQCGDCHKPDSGGLFRTVEQGLCESCHAALTRDATYVHGPAAVNACLFCHDYHRASIPKLLLADATDLCLQCHRRADLTVGRHHAELDSLPCIECHDPHGGADRLFLKPGAR